MRTTEKFTILSDSITASITQAPVGTFSPRIPLQNVEINLHRETVSTPKEALLGRKMAKPRSKKNKESSTQTDANPDESNTVSAEDLTGDAPSEQYWKKLAETKAAALINALETNRLLSEKIKELEEEMKLKDEMLDEARAMAEVIKELVGDT